MNQMPKAQGPINLGTGQSVEYMIQDQARASIEANSRNREGNAFAAWAKRSAREAEQKRMAEPIRKAMLQNFETCLNVLSYMEDTTDLIRGLSYDRELGTVTILNDDDETIFHGSAHLAVAFVLAPRL